jgi:hypothetical protein
MPELYTGCIVEEGITDNRILNTLTIIKFRIRSHEDPAKRWHLCTVHLSLESLRDVDVRVAELRSSGTVPRLATVMIGDNPASGRRPVASVTSCRRR